MKTLALSAVLLALPLCSLALPQPAPVDEYAIHEDGGLVYDPLRREAERTGRLALYEGCETAHSVLKLGRYTLRFDTPKHATAYDVVPIDYELTWNDRAGGFPVAVEATAFEDESRRRGRDCFDLALPGRIDLKVDYLGSITAHLIPGARHNLAPDMTDTPGVYPGFERKPFVRSGVVEAGDLVWFRFRYTNTGNTILDPEGIGGCQFYPELHKRNAKGEFELYGNPYNLYVRDLEYLYPGESHEAWFHFAKSPYNMNAPPEPGEYLIKLRLVYRDYKGFNTFVNIWDGPPAFVYEQPITVETIARKAAVAPGKVTLTDAGGPDKITRWIHTHEEFLTAFDCYSAKPEAATVKGRLHLQVAPWTENVVVKLIAAKPSVAMRSVAIPIQVESDSLQVRFNPDHQVTVTRNGLREPAMWSQCMADMRTGVQLGPFPEKHIPERMREMMDCGVNTVAFTSMPWLYDDMHKPKANYQGDAWKYFLDCARRAGMHAEGWGSYPYDRSSIQQIASWITGKEIKMANFMTDGYPAIDHCDPDLPAANAAAWLYQFHRWGDMYYQMPSGEVPIGIEDTRGWMRQDVNVRNPEGDLTLTAFRDWAKARYGSIETANSAWGSGYKSFDEVDPQADQVANIFGHRWEFTNAKNPFRDWSPAIADFDEFRTLVRVGNYRDTLDIVRKEIPTVKFLLRTEGGNVVVSGVDPESRNTHMRHIYYSQRRCGIIADVLRKSGLVRFHSDYTTMPYTPSELRSLTRLAVKQGIIPIYLAQFDNMRDIAVNARYGTEFQVHYNLPEPRKGQMMHVLTALYPWFKAVYEEGGVPAILWEDYQCDGFATETQKREMRFFADKLRSAMSAPEALAARKAGEQPSQDWRKGARALPSYRNAQ